MPTSQRARNVGSGYTIFRWDGKTIAYLETVVDSGQGPIVQPVALQPLGEPHPVEIVVPDAITYGTLTLTITELWHQEVWENMAGLAGTDNVVDIFRKLAQRQNPVSCAKVINPPTGKQYGKVYHNCQITGVGDGDNITIQTLNQDKTVTIWYTHTTDL